MADIKVSAMTTKAASTGTCTYTIDNAGGYGKTAIGGSDRIPFNDATGRLIGTSVAFAVTTATRAFVKNQTYVTAATAPVISVLTRTGAVVATSGDYSVGQVTGAAPLASTTFTGSPPAPTAAAGDRSTLLATTAFVQSLFD